VSEFDPAANGSRRWTSLKLTGKSSVTDFARQTKPGTVALVRRRPGKPDQPETLVRQSSVMDPLTFILRLRLAPGGSVRLPCGSGGSSGRCSRARSRSSWR